MLADPGLPHNALSVTRSTLVSLRWIGFRWLAACALLLLTIAGCGANDDAEVTSPVGVAVVPAQVELAPAPRETPVVTKYEVPFQIASDATQVVTRTSQGYLVSKTAGRTWRRLPPAIAPRGDRFGDSPAFDVHDTMTASFVIDPAGLCRRVTFRRSGRPAHVTRAPGPCVGQLAVPDDRRALLLTTDYYVPGYQPARPFYVSRDDGMTWKQVSLLPKGLSQPNALGADGDVVVSLWATIRPLVVSRDGGATWTRLALPRDDCRSADVSGQEMWIACDRRIYRSPDAGQRWQAWNLPDVDLKGSPETAGLIVDRIVALGPTAR